MAAMADLATGVQLAGENLGARPASSPRTTRWPAWTGSRAAYDPEGGSTPGWGGVVSEPWSRYLDLEMAALPDRVVVALQHGPVAPTAAAIGSLPDRVRRAPDRNIGWPSTLMPGVTPSMWDWWFRVARGAATAATGSGTPRPRERAVGGQDQR